MATLRQIEMFLDSSYHSLENKAFFPRTRVLCNYIERALLENDLPSEYSRLNIYLSKNIENFEVKPLKAVPILGATILYDEKSFLDSTGQEFQNHCIEALKMGLELTDKKFPMPIDFCSKAIRSFIEGGYENTWIQDKKEWKREKVKSVVVAKLSAEKLELIQTIFCDSKLVGQMVIAEEVPRELVFNDLLGKLFKTKEGLIEYRKKSLVLSRFNLKTGEFLSYATTHF